MLSQQQEQEIKEVVKELQGEVDDHLSKFTFPVALLDFHQMAQGYDVVKTDSGMPYFNFIIDYQTVAQITIDPESITPEALSQLSVSNKKVNGIDWNL